MRTPCSWKKILARVIVLVSRSCCCCDIHAEGSTDLQISRLFSCLGGSFRLSR